MRPRVLLVEDDPDRGEVILRGLTDRFDCHHVRAIEEAMLALPGGGWAAVIVDYDLAEGGSGLEVLQVVRETAPHTFRLFYTNYSTASLLRDVERLAHPHFMANARDAKFILTLRQALENLLLPAAPLDDEPVPSILEDVWTSRSPMSAEFLRQLQAAAESESPVYLFGEPGTGKTRAALLLRRWRAAWRARGSPGASSGAAAVPVIRVPALRERLQDLPVLAARILTAQARQNGEPVRRLSKRALAALLAREWRGNTVELVGVLVRAYQRAGSRPVLDLDDLPQDTQPAWRPSQYAKDEGQRDCVLRQLRTARSVSAASRLEGCSRANYIRLMRRLGILRADVVEPPDPVDGEDDSLERH